MGFARYFLFSLFLYLSCGSECPFERSCNCTRTARFTYSITVICSYKNLQAIPYMDNQAPLIEKLYGQYNNITEIPSKIFLKATNLIELDLSNNRISVLFNDSFTGLDNLESLNLEHNNLVYKLENIPLTCFQSVLQLRNLNLKNNVGPYTSGQYYPNISLLTKLEMLKFDGLSDDDFHARFDTLTALKVLELSSEACSIGRMKSDYFLSVPNLQYIDISNCKVKKIWKNTFTRLKNLTYLDVSYNLELRFSGIANITHDLPFTSIEIFKLNKIHKTFEMNTRVEYETVKYLKNTKLKELYADSNRIQEVQTGVSSIMPKTLDVLSMADNMLSYGIYILESKNLNITFFNVSFQYTSHFIESVIPKSSKLLNSRHRRSLGVHFPIPFPKNLRELHFRRSQLQYDIPEIRILENNLEYLDVSRNLLSKWNGPTVNFNKLKFLNMSNNYGVNISTKFFNGTPNLEELYIQNNLLGFSLPYDTHGLILKPLRKLSVIDLSQNRISELSFPFFGFQEKLEKIDLHENFLEEIDFEITHMKNLSYLDLSENRIQYLGESAISQLESLAKDHVMTLDLSKNPFICTCKSLKFLNWMSSTSIRLVNGDEYKCKYDKGNIEQMSDIKNVYNNLNKACSSYPGILIGITSGIVLFVAIALFGIFYRYRWKLRYLYYMMKNRFRGYVPVMQESDIEYLYDAFISYAEEDSKFVHNDVVDNLEKNGNLKLCLHRRDFIAGNEIAANITSAIHNSRRTVVILSQHFLESNWCMFEFNMARMEGIYTRENGDILYLVFLTSIPPRDLPLIMMEYINSNTYIEYPNDEYGNVVFWQRMREALNVDQVSV